MKKLLRKIVREGEPLKASIFKILGCSGFAVSLVISTYSFAVGKISDGFINFATAILSLILIWWVDKTKRYVAGYLITVFAIFIGLFTVLYLQGGGYFSGMPYYFVLAIIFTFLIFDGWIAYVTVGFEVVYYVALMVFSAMKPELISDFPTETARLVDIIVGVLVNAIGVGIVFKLYTNAYKRQQKIAEEASKAKSQFLANMSHEIRTPINIILGMNDMIIKENKDDTIKHYAQMSEMAGNQLLELVNQILDYSKTEAGNVELINEIYCFSEEINRLGMMSSETIKEKGLEFKYKVDESIPEYLYGDIGKIKQILINILTNATKYTDRGTITFTCENVSDKGDRTEIKFSIADTGRGIKQEDIPRLFDNFSRADIFKNRNIQGTGLGLAISKMYANMLEGSIDVESKYGEGSVFTFTLWQEKSTKEEFCMKENDSRDSVKHVFIAPSARILVVDDNEMNLNLDKALLRSLMCKVDTATSANEAFRWVEKNEYDLIFMDYMMPETDGVEAMKQIRKMQGKKHTPIVVLTADVMGNIREDLLNEGFEDYVAKPVKESELKRIVFNYVDQNKILESNESVLELSAEDKIDYRNKLAKYDIDFEKGMSLLGNDIVQYASALTFFSDNYQKGRKELDGLVEKGDYDGVKYLVHSLKSTSGSIGATELQEIARQAEKHIKNDDFEYFDVIYGVLILQWERVVKGIEAFNNDIEDIKSKYMVINKDNVLKGELLGHLFECIRDCQGKPAVDIIEEMMKDERWSDKKAQLEKVKDCIENIEFEEAEKLVREIVNNGH